MPGNILEFIINPLINILLYFVIISYFITFIFTLLFVISKKLMLGEISNMFFIISAALNLILVILEIFMKGFFIIDSRVKVLILLILVLAVIYIIIELFYKIKMGGIFVILAILILSLMVLFMPKINFKDVPDFVCENNLLYMFMILGFLVFFGSYYNGVSVFFAGDIYSHFLREKAALYIKISRNLDILSIICLSGSVIFRYILLRQLENLFFWRMLKVEIISAVLIFIIMRTFFLYKNFDKSKLILRFYKILGLILWIAIFIFNKQLL